MPSDADFGPQTGVDEHHAGTLAAHELHHFAARVIVGADRWGSKGGRLLFDPPRCHARIEILPSTGGESTGMRVRVFAKEFHTDPSRLEEEVNECIKSSENLGDTVLDADVVIRPNGQVPHGMEYLIVIKFEGNRHSYFAVEVLDDVDDDL